MILGFLAPNYAALADLHAQNPSKLGAVNAMAGAYAGIGCALGPLIGSKFPGHWSFLLSSLAFVGTFLYSKEMEETLSLSNRKQFKASDINPLAFLKLFKTENMKNLTLAALFQSFGDYFNIYDMNNLFMIQVLKYNQAQIGNFATGVGISQMLGGRFTKSFIEKNILEDYSVVLECNMDSRHVSDGFSPQHEASFLGLGHLDFRTAASFTSQCVPAEIWCSRGYGQG